MTRYFPAALLALLLLCTQALGQPAGFTVTRNVPFNAEPALLADIFLPDDVTDATPVLVYFFGGNWEVGSRRDAFTIARDLARAGNIVVAPDYRVRPTLFPGIAEDCAGAVGWTVREFRKADGTPRPLFLSGFSSGAYNAALLSVDPRYLEAVGVAQDAITGFIGLAGPYWEVPQREPHPFPPDSIGDYDLAGFVDKSDPPMLLIQGDTDEFYTADNIQDFAAVARTAGIRVTTLVVSRRYHAHMEWDLSTPGTEVRAVVDAFIARHAPSE